MEWHAVATEPGDERLARQSLRSIGVQVVLPLRREEIKLPRGARGTVERPLWPGYLIAGWDEGDDWTAIVRQRGVASVLHAAGDPYNPAIVPGWFVERLLKRMSLIGVVEDLSVTELLPEIQAGAAVRLVDGVFVEKTGICEWSTEARIRLLLDVAGIRVTVPRNMVREA